MTQWYQPVSSGNRHPRFLVSKQFHINQNLGMSRLREMLYIQSKLISSLIIQLLMGFCAIWCIF